MSKLKNQMRELITLFVMFIFIFPISQIYLSSAYAISIATGSKVGTYYQFGLDIARVAKDDGLDVIIKTSNGSIDNIKLMEIALADLGIVQSDVLGLLYKMKPKIADRLKYVFPLYKEEVHILARKEINSIEDLNGKKIATGSQSSGNWVTISNLLYWSIVPNVKKITNLNPVDALNALLAGEIDAMVYVAGKPVALFKRLEKIMQNPHYKKMLKEVHFIPLSIKETLKEKCNYYVASEIGPSDYAWVDRVTPTIAVSALLVNITTQKERYEKQLIKLAESVRKSLDNLKQNGHNKWKQVDLDAPIGEPWKLESCVLHQISTEALKQDLKELFK